MTTTTFLIGTVTFLLTSFEGRINLSELPGGAMRPMEAVHDALLRPAVLTHKSVEVAVRKAAAASE